MERLVSLSQETVGLGMLADGHHVYIAQEECPQELRWVVRIGMPAPLNMGAGPRAVLGYLPEREREAIIEGLSFEDAGPTAPQDAEGLREVLAEIRRTGISLNYGERIGQSAGIAVPILGRGGRPVGALALGGAEARLTEQTLNDLREPLLAATRELSRQLGYIGALP